MTLSKVNRFVEGLRSNIAFEIRKLGINKFEEPVEIAKRVDSAMQVTSETINTIQVTLTNDKLVETITEISTAQANESIDILWP